MFFMVKEKLYKVSKLSLKNVNVIARKNFMNFILQPCKSLQKKTKFCQSLACPNAQAGGLSKLCALCEKNYVTRMFMW